MTRLNTIGIARVCFCNSSRWLRRQCDKHIGPQRDQLLPESMRSDPHQPPQIGNRRGPLRPSDQPNCSKPLPEPGKAPLHFKIVLYTVYQNANAPRACRLLRLCRDRPRAAAPPSSVMNSRRFIRSPRRRGRAATAARPDRAPCGPEIDHQLVFGQRLNRQIGRLLTLEDAFDIASRAPKLIDNVIPIGH